MTVSTFKRLMLAGAVATVSMAGAASAATQLIHFDDLATNPNNSPQSNGSKTYETADSNFYMAQADNGGFLVSGNCAVSVLGGNGSCLGDDNDGDVATLTRLSGDKAFSLNSFYFTLLGEGGGGNPNSPNPLNGITITDNNGVTHSLTIGDSVTKYGAGTLFDYPDGSVAATGTVVHNVAYIFDITTLTGFDAITSVAFSTPATANVRVDCISVTFSGTTTDPAKGYCGLDGGGGGEFEVPVPASLPLMVTALGVFGFMRRKARKSA